MLKALKARGFTRGLSWIREAGRIAHAFRDAAIRIAAPYSVLRVADDPETLEELIRRAKAKGEPLTVALARKLKRGLKPPVEGGAAYLADERLAKLLNEVQRLIKDHVFEWPKESVRKHLQSSRAIIAALAAAEGEPLREAAE
jgi:hypothetical protein